MSVKQVNHFANHPIPSNQTNQPTDQPMLKYQTKKGGSQAGCLRVTGFDGTKRSKFKFIRTARRSLTGEEDMVRIFLSGFQVD